MTSFANLSYKGSTNKAKIAKRVIEVLDYFDERHQQATVMDIVRRYDRPQSSTSELMTSLVELGLLHKDPYLRVYRPTARAAFLGIAGQLPALRDGRLLQLIDRLGSDTGHPVILFGLVGLRSQVLTWRPGGRCHSHIVQHLYTGLQEPLSNSASGWLLMSTIAPARCEGVLRRLNAEASEKFKFSPQQMNAQLEHCRETGSVRGPAGFGMRGKVLASLLPASVSEQTLAIGLIHCEEEQIEPQHLFNLMSELLQDVMVQDQ